MFTMRLIGVILAASLLIACSDDDDDSKGQGSIGFLHTVTDAALIRVEGNNRYYGTYAYGNLGTPIGLTEGGYAFDIVEQDLQNSSANKTLASDSFSVNPNRIRLSVLHGSVEGNDVDSTTFSLGRDEDAGRNENDPDARYMNVSNAYVGTDSVTFKFINFTTSDESRTETLAFGETSATIEFDSSEYTLVVTNDADGSELYKSEAQPIKDQIEQTMIIANHAGLKSTGVTAYYYGTVYRDTWANKSVASTNKGYVKVVNTILGKTGDDVDYPAAPVSFELFLQNEDGTETDVTPAVADVVYGATSVYEPYDGGSYILRLSGQANWGYAFTLAADSAFNIDLYGYDVGNGPESTPLGVFVDKRVLKGFATVQFQHLAVEKPNDSASLVLDVHIVPAGLLPNDSTRMISGLTAGGSTTFSINLTASSYTLYLTKSGLTSTWVAELPLLNPDTSPMQNGDNGLFFIYNAGTGSTSTGYSVVNASKDIP